MRFRVSCVLQLLLVLAVVAALDAAESVSAMTEAPCTKANNVQSNMRLAYNKARSNPKTRTYCFTISAKATCNVAASPCCRKTNLVPFLDVALTTLGSACSASYKSLKWTVAGKAVNATYKTNTATIPLAAAMGKSSFSAQLCMKLPAAASCSTVQQLCGGNLCKYTLKSTVFSSAAGVPTQCCTSGSTTTAAPTSPSPPPPSPVPSPPPLSPSPPPLESPSPPPPSPAPPSPPPASSLPDTGIIPPPMPSISLPGGGSATYQPGVLLVRPKERLAACNDTSITLSAAHAASIMNIGPSSVLVGWLEALTLGLEPPSACNIISRKIICVVPSSQGDLVVLLTEVAALQDVFSRVVGVLSLADNLLVPPGAEDNTTSSNISSSLARSSDWVTAANDKSSAVTLKLGRRELNLQLLKTSEFEMTPILEAGFNPHFELDWQWLADATLPQLSVLAMILYPSFITIGYETKMKTSNAFAATYKHDIVPAGAALPPIPFAVGPVPLYLKVSPVEKLELKVAAKKEVEASFRLAYTFVFSGSVGYWKGTGFNLDWKSDLKKDGPTLTINRACSASFEPAFSQGFKFTLGVGIPTPGNILIPSPTEVASFTIPSATFKLPLAADMGVSQPEQQPTCDNDPRKTCDTCDAATPRPNLQTPPKELHLNANFSPALEIGVKASMEGVFKTVLEAAVGTAVKSWTMTAPLTEPEHFCLPVPSPAASFLSQACCNLAACQLDMPLSVSSRFGVAGRVTITTPFYQESYIVSTTGAGAGQGVVAVAFNRVGGCSLVCDAASSDPAWPSSYLQAALSTAKLKTPKGMDSAYQTTSAITGVGSAANEPIYFFEFTVSGVSGTIEEISLWSTNTPMAAVSPRSLEPLYSTLQSGTVDYVLYDRSDGEPKIADMGSFGLAGNRGMVRGCKLSARAASQDLFLDCTPSMEVVLESITTDEGVIQADLVITGIDLTAASRLADSKPQPVG